MESSPVSRLRKKPTTASISIPSRTPTPSRKLRLVCRFNGAFQPNPPSHNLRYVGGDTRIVSVDRNISFSMLLSKISYLCPNGLPLSLRYHILSLSPQLLSLSSDHDVRCMIQAYDKLELCGKRARPWLFVCSSDDCADDDDNYTTNGFGFIKGKGNYVERESESENDHAIALCGNVVTGFDAFRSTNGALSCSQSESHDKVAKNPVAVNNDVGRSDHSSRRVELKQQLLAKQTNRVHGIRHVSGLDVADGSCEMDFASCAPVIDHKYPHPLIDLEPEPDPLMTTQPSIQGIENYCNLIEYPWPNLHPLHTRDRNLNLGMEGSVPCFSGSNIQVCGNGTGSDARNSNHLCNPDAISMFNGIDVDQDLRNAGQRSLSNLNRENIMPWAVDCNLWSFSSGYCGSAYPMQSPSGRERVWGAYQNGIRNHKHVVNDARHQRVSPYQIRNHRNNLVEMCYNEGVRLEGRRSVVKCYPGLKANANISKQGQFMRVHRPNSWKAVFCENVSERRPSIGYSLLDKENLSCSLTREQIGLAVSKTGNSNPNKSRFTYHGAGAAVSNQSFSSCIIIERSSSCLAAMDSQQDLLTGSPYNTHDVPSIDENYQGVPINSEQVMSDWQKAVRISGSSHAPASSNVTTPECNENVTDTGGDGNLSTCSKSGTYCLHGGIASSVDLLDNLSLSSSKKPEPAFLSSILWKPRLKPLDFMAEVQLGRSPKTDESKEVAANTFSQNTCNMEKDQDHEDKIQVQQKSLSGLSIDEKDVTKESFKCSKVIGGISGDLAAFYTHLATQELQTIKNSDLEYIKELGSGACGTVYHGKWKGSDVAIKKIKPTCLNEGLLEEDRLVADFWREAHILGQLHHPNIVAFYGIVTDGSVNNLATVTEYMVNGSLKQVLQRKDRTIDRRKRLILAMDAAFGMEYLHEKNIVHFDLKSHNFLVNIRDPQRPVCKIGDLGLSKIKKRTLVSGGVRGTIPWMAPELLNSNNKMVTEKVDVYSFGVVMWELLTGEEPYANMRSEEIIGGIIKGTLRPEIPSWCDPVWRSLMERCWSSDPNSRPAFSEIAKELRSMSSAMNIK